MVNIAVIGAGVVGLSTAINIQNAIPGSKVKVIADNFEKDITSYGSGGLFVPSSQSHPGVNVDLLRKWSQRSWTFYQQLVTGPDAGVCGGVIMTGYYLSKTEYQDPLYKEIVFSYRKLSDLELSKLGFPSVYKYGYQVTTLVLNQRKYLNWLMKRFQQNGGDVEKRKVNDLEELVGRYDVVVNCTGLGSRQLVGDTTVHPVNGHIVRIKAPWIKHWIYTDDVTYIIPGEDLIGLGGTKQVGNGDTTVDPEVTREIIERCERLSPSIKDAVVDHSWVGLRPGRDNSVRLEAETMNFTSGRLRVVHNYGHGPNGVALSWGTSMDAADLVVNMLSRPISRL